MRELEKEGLEAFLFGEEPLPVEHPHEDLHSMDVLCEHIESPVEWEDRPRIGALTIADFLVQPHPIRSRRLLDAVFTKPVLGRARSKAEGDDIEEKFRQLFAQWQSETEASSWISESALHPAYQQIIGLGPDVIPVLLRELSRRPAHLFWALRAITGENPVRPEDAGDIGRMRAAWLDWGETKGLI